MIREVLSTAQECLPEAQRSAFVLVRLQGLSYPEAAGRLRISITSVRQNLYRAGLRLRKHMNERRIFSPTDI